MLAAIADPKSGAKAFVQKWCVGQAEQAVTRPSGEATLRSGSVFTVPVPPVGYAAKQKRQGAARFTKKQLDFLAW